MRRTRINSSRECLSYGDRPVHRKVHPTKTFPLLASGRGAFRIAVDLSGHSLLSMLSWAVDPIATEWTPHCCSQSASE
jgi:hypothetical protein